MEQYNNQNSQQQQYIQEYLEDLDSTAQSLTMRNQQQDLKIREFEVPFIQKLNNIETKLDELKDDILNNSKDPQALNLTQNLFKYQISQQIKELWQQQGKYMAFMTPFFPFANNSHQSLAKKILQKLKQYLLTISDQFNSHKNSQQKKIDFSHNFVKDKLWITSNDKQISIPVSQKRTIQTVTQPLGTKEFLQFTTVNLKIHITYQKQNGNCNIKILQKSSQNILINVREKNTKNLVSNENQFELQIITNQYFGINDSQDSLFIDKINKLTNGVQSLYEFKVFHQRAAQQIIVIKRNKKKINNKQTKMMKLDNTLPIRSETKITWKLVWTLHYLDQPQEFEQMQNTQI